MKDIITKAVEGGLSPLGLGAYTDNFPIAYEKLIFSHKFAKAYWGEGLLDVANNEEIYEWQYHLQQLVLCEDRMKYLRSFL